jgi:predicted small secreted protein
MKKLISIVLVLSFMALLGGCETMKGLGEDIQKAGKAIEKKASE